MAAGTQGCPADAGGALRQSVRGARTAGTEANRAPGREERGRMHGHAPGATKEGGGVAASASCTQGPGRSSQGQEAREAREARQARQARQTGRAGKQGRQGKAGRQARQGRQGRQEQQAGKDESPPSRLGGGGGHPGVPGGRGGSPPAECPGGANRRHRGQPSAGARGEGAHARARAGQARTEGRQTAVSPLAERSQAPPPGALSDGGGEGVAQVPTEAAER